MPIHKKKYARMLPTLYTMDPRCVLNSVLMVEDGEKFDPIIRSLNDVLGNGPKWSTGTMILACHTDWPNEVVKTDSTKLRN